MRPGIRFGLSAIEKRDVWSRWKAGQSLHEIGRAFDKPHSCIRAVFTSRRDSSRCSSSLAMGTHLRGARGHLPRDRFGLLDSGDSARSGSSGLLRVPGGRSPWWSSGNKVLRRPSELAAVIGQVKLSRKADVRYAVTGHLKSWYGT